MHQESPRSDIFRKRATKPLLKQKHCQKHLTWAKEKNNWGLIYKTLRTFHPKSVRMHRSLILHTCEFFHIYKTVHMPEPAQKFLYKSQSGEDCAYVHLHPDSSQKSPYMELATPSFTMHNLICILFPCIFPSTCQRYKTLRKYEILTVIPFGP